MMRQSVGLPGLLFPSTGLAVFEKKVSLEASHSLRILGNALRQDLEGYVTFKLGVGCSENSAHTTFTYECRDFVVG